uniref:protein tweety homolog 3-like n=1 Tax=Styela clava TaxID=7725 RepID=UPI00193A239C|nr:protein tweety homolog 3-like [Styela clava]
MGNYSASWLVDLFHSVPHISFQFTVLSKEDYHFDNPAYWESLAMIALMAIFLLLFTMMGFAIYFCCLKAKGGEFEGKDTDGGCYCSVCVLVVFVMLNLAGIGIAVYGNMQTGDGIKVVAVAVRTANDTFVSLNDKVRSLLDSTDELMESITELKEMKTDDIEILNMEGYSHKIYDALNVVAVPLDSIEDRLGWAVEIVVVTEYYRSLVTFCLLAFQCFVCFLGMIGLCCRSKCTLIVTIVLGTFCLTATYFYVGADLPISVAAADFCVDPFRAIYNQTVNKGYMSEKVANYFLKCETDEYHPYSSEIEDGRIILQKMEHSAEIIRQENITEEQEVILHSIETKITEMFSLITSLNVMVDCEPSKIALGQTITSICGPAMEGLFALAAAMLATGLCMTFAICAAAKTGKQYGRHVYRRDSSDLMEYDDDPFLPRTTNYRNNSARNSNITRTNNPIYATTTSTNSNYGVATNTLSFFREGSDEDVSLIENPPPYSPPRPSSRYSP